MKSRFAFAAAALCFLVAAPISVAQVTPADPAAPASAAPATPADPVVTTPAAPSDAAPATPAAPAAPATTPAPDPAVAPPANTSAAVSGNAACRTRKDVGQQCSCLSAPTNFGTSQVADAGAHNVCVVPAG